MAGPVKLMRSFGFDAPVSVRTASIQFSIDSETSALPRVGKWGQQNIPFDCTITGWTLTADQVGSAVITVLRSTYEIFPATAAISGSDKPTLASVQKNENLGPLTNWDSISISAGDQIQISLDSVTACKALNLSLLITIP